MPEGFSFYFHL